MANTVSELCDMQYKAQKLLESVSKELTVINRALRTTGHNPVFESVLNDLAEVYMLHYHVMNNSYIYPKEE